MNGAIKVEPTRARRRAARPPVEIVSAEHGVIRVASPIGALQGPKDKVMDRLAEHGARLDANLVSRTRAYERTRLTPDLNAMLAAAMRWADWHEFLLTLKDGADGQA